MRERLIQLISNADEECKHSKDCKLVERRCNRMKQYDIFGNAEEVILQPLRGRKKYTTMQELHGIKEGETCKTCKHCIACGYNRTYYKCDLWIKSSSAATDIRLKNKACNKWEAKGGAE